jgi:hypothetical protein
MPSEAESDTTKDGRSSARFATQVSVGVRRSGAVSIPGVVIDISSTGFRIEALERLPIGTVVWLKIGNLAPQMARVMWNDKLLAGCQFAAPLHPSVIAQLLSAPGA